MILMFSVLLKDRSYAGCNISLEAKTLAQVD